MSFVNLLSALMAAQTAAVGDPPSAPPSDVSTSLYSGVKIRVSWTNGDATAFSRVYRMGSPNTLLQQVAAGETSYDTGLTSGTFGVSHFKNGQETAIVTEA